MRRLMGAVALLALVALAGLVYAGVSAAGPEAGGFICPLTGHELPCPKCCPMNQGRPASDCPLTGEPRVSAECCPLKGLD